MRDDFPIKQARTKIAMWLRQFGMFVFNTRQIDENVHRGSVERDSASRFLEQLKINPVYGAYRFVRETSLSTNSRHVFTVYQVGKPYKLGWVTLTDRKAYMLFEIESEI